MSFVGIERVAVMQRDTARAGPRSGADASQPATATATATTARTARAVATASGASAGRATGANRALARNRHRARNRLKVEHFADERAQRDDTARVRRQWPDPGRRAIRAFRGRWNSDSRFKNSRWRGSLQSEKMKEVRRNYQAHQ